MIFLTRGLILNYNKWVLHKEISRKVYQNNQRVEETEFLQPDNLTSQFHGFQQKLKHVEYKFHAAI